ncbi:NUDIX hydrolase [Acinetobacter puyangensis]|uniref:NUDIX hydrolase n=1 Tax=Acinetobacter puyangensis TaxID=1096779 RepID=UPI003A4DED0D
MAFHDLYRMSSHAVIFNDRQQILLLKANYANRDWGLPGGGLDPGETIHQALVRECQEELGCEVIVDYLSGVYYHHNVNSHAFIFRCSLAADAVIQLSDEHDAYRWFDLQELSPIQRFRVEDCLNFNGTVVSRSF